MRNSYSRIGHSKPPLLLCVSLFGSLVDTPCDNCPPARTMVQETLGSTQSSSDRANVGSFIRQIGELLAQIVSSLQRWGPVCACNIQCSFSVDNESLS